ncbi:MAG: isochorismate synthase [Oscillatoria sp. SIO1A7]|nr:isochorismate synthase [Oscillatoria sp. SIO1A7]
MPVVSTDLNLLQDRQELARFLAACQQVSVEKGCSQIASISLEIPAVDPLAVLDAIAKPSQLSFYFENGGKGKGKASVPGAVFLDGNFAIAAIDAAITFTGEGKQRFANAGDFLESCQNNIITAGALDLPFSGPHFFASFTFFEECPPNSAFPAATLFLPRWQVARLAKSCVLVANVPVHYRDNPEQLALGLWQKVEGIKLAKYRSPLVYSGNGRVLKKRHIVNPDDFKMAVNSALQSIQASRLSKIVLAHAVDVSSPQAFNIISSLNNLRRIYPDCYIFAANNGKGKHFMGASPERLLGIRNHQLETDALAGSAPRGYSPREDAVLANALLDSEKEKHEHQVVVDFISDRLAKLGLTPQIAPMVRLMQLSNIQHLWTPIRAEVPASIHPLEIIAALHPTPAVAGLPRDIACQEIRRYEAFDRCLYAAPLGWIDYQGNGEFIVGIRSALIEGDRARFYAGAGIVAGSNADKELAEVKLKLNTLLEALV